LILSLSLSTASAQDLRLKITVPKTKLNKTEPINLVLKLINVSKTSYYICGDVSLGVAGIGHQFGKYQLQLRKEGTTDFSDESWIIADGRPLRGSLSTAEFITANRLMLLQPKMFVGTTIDSNWRGFTLREPGR
jgi:hypothetical protein